MNKGSALSSSKGFRRSFLIFSNEDAGYEAGQKPSGHIRLEVREGRGRLHAAVQNLRPGNGRFVYRLYLLDTDGSEVSAAYAGQLAPELNKAELEWSFDPQNVGATGITIDDFNIAAVLVEQEHPGYAVICPLAAYKDKKTEWRTALRTALAKKNMGIENSVEPQKTEEMPYKSPEGHFEPALEPFQFNSVKMPSDVEWQSEGLPIQQNYIFQDHMPQEQPLQEYPPYGQIMQDNLKQDNMSQQQPLQEQYMQENPEKSPNESVNTQQLPFEQDNLKQENVPQQQDTQYQSVAGQIDTGCVYLNGNICGAFVNNGAGAANPCTACHLHHGRPQYTEPPAGDVSQLREELDRYFEQCDPFHSNRSDYMWWRVGNPVNLNNMLYQCNIRSPLLFNPAVMMAHYKYRHLIVGIFLHRAREKQYIVCGVPGMNMVDRKPFGDMSKWVQAEGNRPRYGAFGYWLVYIDPDGGKILNMSQE